MRKGKNVTPTISGIFRANEKGFGFVKIDNSDISVVVDSTKHDKKEANKIMRLVQEEFDSDMNISVKFQK